MNIMYQDIVQVYYRGLLEKQLVGRLFLKNRQIYFEYDTNFIKTGLQLSPFKLPLKTGIVITSDRTFDGLFGVFNDSLPDGWGRLLLDRKLMHAGLNPHSLSPLDRLCYVGNNGMGALVYEPEKNLDVSSVHHDLDEINNEIQSTLDDVDLYLDELILLGGSSAGARPKVLLNINSENWLIKFRSTVDPKDISAIEYAYHLMAKQAGLIVPKAKLFPSRKSLGFFGVQRFDRIGTDRIHMHTVSGLLHADHRELSLDYSDILKTTLYLTKDHKQCEIQFRNAVFNILTHNRDDHAKNFSFLMDANGIWKVSPAYDLTFSSGPMGEHSTLIMGEGKKPTRNHILNLASIVNIDSSFALEVIESTIDASQKWQEFAYESGVSKQQTKQIGCALEEIYKNL